MQIKWEKNTDKGNFPVAFGQSYSYLAIMRNGIKVMNKDSNLILAHPFKSSISLNFNLDLIGN